MTWIDWVIAAFVLFAALQGLRRGVLAALIGGLAVPAGYLAASVWYRPLAEVVARYLRLSPSWSAAVAFTALLLLVVQVIGLVVIAMARTDGVPAISRLVGAVVGALRGILLATALLVVALAAPPAEPLQRDMDRSAIAPFAVAAFRDGLRALGAVLPPAVRPFGATDERF